MVDSEREGEDHVVVDGVPGPSFSEIDWNSVQFTPDGRDFLYIARRHDETFFVRNDKVQRRFKSSLTVADVSADGKRVALKVGAPSSETLVIEGEVGASFESQPCLAIDGVRFSPDGRRFVARVHFEDKSMAGLVDGRIGTRYEHVGPPVFTADSTHVLQAVRVNGAVQISTDGQLGESTYQMIEELTVSPLGNHVAFRAKAKEGPEELLVIDGVEQFRGTEIRNLMFSPSGESLACVARGKNGHPNAILNGIRIGDVPAIKRLLQFTDESSLRFVTAHDGFIWQVDVQAKVSPQ